MKGTYQLELKAENLFHKYSIFMNTLKLNTSKNILNLPNQRERAQLISAVE